ncbi:FAD-dependent oxidoreductase [Arthrobacter hankyongi]|uniref:FAD-dependent oxidoreductase n=1 Tax=Arthrobacter hankyongi TaxID=2904801 RepID=UPI0027E168BE|nr:FAD-dependent oxidoreductase [Arthrobacter hankyongi]
MDGSSGTIGVVGGGIVGIAIARALALQGHGQVTVLEKEDRVALHQTGHNSGVVHAGIYYAPGSLKAQLCVRGRAMVKEYCQDKQLPYREAGKLVVAVDDSELAALDVLEQRSRANDVPGLRRLGSEELRDIEPHAAGIAALHSPHTAVVDYAAITEAMAGDVRQAGGAVLPGHEVTAIRRDGGGVRVTAGGAEFAFDRLVVCAGLQSDVVAGFIGAPKSPKILPFRGEYWTLSAATSIWSAG